MSTAQPQPDVSRRAVLLAGLGALVVGVHLPGVGRAEGTPYDDVDPNLNAFVSIDADGNIEVFGPSSEMGQGVSTALPMLVAEELDADWSRVRYRHAPADDPYKIRMGPLRMQVTGGSRSVMAWYDPLREAGAMARAVLILAAAREWGVHPATCATRASVVHHPETGRQASYGQLADAASRLKAPSRVALKDPEDFTLIGTNVDRLDLPDKVTGRAVFGADVRLPGMVYATAVACPVFGGRVASVDDAAAAAVPGVIAVMPFDDWVAVVADGFWPAKQGANRLRITWDEGDNHLDTATVRRILVEGLDQPRATKTHKRGDPDPWLQSDDLFEAVYEVPYLDHAPMEPMNCTAHVTGDRCDVWVGTQSQTRAQSAAMKITGLKRSRVHIHTTLLGGGFGRRGNEDFVEQAVTLSHRLGIPVQLQWTREETLRHGFYRPAFAARVRASTSASGRPNAMHLRVCGDNVVHRYVPKVLRRLPPIQAFASEGLGHTNPYRIRNLLVDYVPAALPIPIGFWRSVSYSHNCFFLESAIDELAVAADRDPVELRMELLVDAPRFQTVLQRAAEASGWGQAPEGRFQGVAIQESFGSLAAEVAEVSVDAGQIRVHRITVAVDCGQVVHPANVEAQMMGGVLYGLSAALYGQITLDGGRVTQSNFHDYPLLRLSEAPEVDVQLVRSPGSPLGGIGEVGTPPVAPAVCNALFRATGRRIRRLPIAAALARPDAEGEG